MLRTVAAVTLFAAPVLALAACSPNEPVATSPGTTPAIWTGSPAPSAPHGHEGSPGHEGSGHVSSDSPGETLTADLKLADGTTVATADVEFADGFATVTVQTQTEGKLTPGFHGMHIHSVGKCEADSVAPTGGAPANFNSAGGHFQIPGHSGHPASGDLVPLQVREDGSALLVTTTDAFTDKELLDGAGTAIVIHAQADNFAHIPPESYRQVDGDLPPGQATLATGDAGARVACGVITRS